MVPLSSTPQMKHVPSLLEGSGSLIGSVFPNKNEATASLGEGGGSSAHFAYLCNKMNVVRIKLPHYRKEGAPRAKFQRIKPRLRSIELVCFCKL